MAALRVIRPGMLTTIQDLGRWGYQHLGVPVAGPMDWYAHRLANRLVGNTGGAATLEITLLGPELEAEGDVTCALTGAEFEVAVGGAVAPAGRAFELACGQRLRFGARRTGARAYLAVSGGFTPEPILGSRATSLSGRMGPLDGRALKAGDLLPVGQAFGSPSGGAPLELPSGGGRLRVIRGPHDDRFSPEAHRLFTTERFTITPESNRMGYRLTGPRLGHQGGADILSDATPVGSIQVPASGQPILLMADRQTTGGYPKIATVITADLPIAGQLAPGDWIEFGVCSHDEAEAALRDRLSGLGEGTHERGQ